MNVALVDLRVAEDLFNGLQSASEKVLAQFFEASTSQRRVEINALEKRINLDGCLCSRG